MNTTLKGLLRSKRFGIQLGPVKGESDVDYKYQVRALSVVPIAVLLIVGFFAAVLGGVWLSVFQQVTESWGRIDNLFSLTTALFMTFWLIGWSVGAFAMVTAFFIMLTGRQVVLVHSGRMETILGVIGIGLKINLRASEVVSSHLTGAGSGGGSKTGRQIQVETNEGEKGNSPFGRNMTERDLADFQQAIDRNRKIESGLGDMPIGGFKGVDDEPSHNPKSLLNRHSEPLANAEMSNAVESLTLSSPSTILLIVANVVPLIGVVLFGWDLGSTMVLYWAETAIILFYTICKGFVRNGWLGLLGSLFTVVHAGAFMSVHFLFIWSIFVEGFGNEASFNGGDLNQVATYLSGLWPALLALMLSHGFSFKTNFLDKMDALKANTKKAAQESANSFYSRIVSMHVTIIFGGGAAMILGSGVFALLMLIAIKITVDVRAHLKQHATS